MDGRPGSSSRRAWHLRERKDRGVRHNTSGVGTGASVIASTSRADRSGSASIFRNTSPTRTVTRSLFARTTSTAFTAASCQAPTLRRRGVPARASRLRGTRRMNRDSTAAAGVRGQLPYGLRAVARRCGPSPRSSVTGSSARRCPGGAGVRSGRRVVGRDRTARRRSLRVRRTTRGRGLTSALRREARQVCRHIR